MASKYTNSGPGSLPEKWIEQADGSYTRQVATFAVDASGTPQTALPPGRANAAASVPVALSAEDYARISQTYRRAGVVGVLTGGGDGLLVTGVTTAGTVNLTLVNGGTISVSVPLGSSTLAYSASAATLGTAVGATFQNLFFT